MTCTKDDVEKIVGHLNSLLIIDKSAITTLIEGNVRCNSKLVEHPCFIFDEYSKRATVLGMLNGILRLLGSSYVVAAVSSDNSGIKEFLAVPFSPLQDTDHDKP